MGVSRDDQEVVVTNLMPIPEEKQFSKLRVLSTAPLIASALRAIFEDTSVSDIFGGENQLKVPRCEGHLADSIQPAYRSSSLPPARR